MMILVATLSVHLLSATLVQAGDDNNPIANGFVSASTGLPAASSDHAIWFGDIDNDTFLDVATLGIGRLLQLACRATLTTEAFVSAI
jgi:hypothetical protein